MDRKEFIAFCWRKIIKPLIYIIGIFFCINFLINAIRGSGTERLIIIICFGIAVLLATATVLGLLISSLNELIFKRLSNKNKSRLRIMERVLNYLATMAYGGVIYYLYQRNEWNPIIILSVMVIHSIIKIIKEEEQATTRTTS